MEDTKEDETDASDKAEDPNFAIRTSLPLSVCYPEKKHSSSDPNPIPSGHRTNGVTLGDDAEILQRAESVEANARVYEHESLIAWQAGAQKRDEYECSACDQSEDSNDCFSVHAR